MASFLEGLLLGQLLNSPSHIEDEFTYDELPKPMKSQHGPVRMYINVKRDAKDPRIYHISINDTKLKSAIESIGIRGLEDFDLALEFCQSKYRAKGVTITDYNWSYADDEVRMNLEPSIQDKINDPKYRLLKYYPSIAASNYHQGLMIKTVVHVTAKDKEIYKPQWMRAACGLPQNAKICEEQATSYFHSEKNRIEREQKCRSKLPLRYLPIKDIKMRITFFLSSDNKEITQKYHAGEPLPIVSISCDDEGISNMDELNVVRFACSMGFTHIPVIFYGNLDKKKEFEDKWKDEVFVREKGHTVT